MNTTHFYLGSIDPKKRLLVIISERLHHRSVHLFDYAARISLIPGSDFVDYIIGQIGDQLPGKPEDFHWYHVYESRHFWAPVLPYEIERLELAKNAEDKYFLKAKHESWALLIPGKVKAIIDETWQTLNSLPGTV